MNSYVAIDLDNTIAEFNGWGGEEHVEEPKSKARSDLFALRRMGFKIIIFTCRDNEEIIESYMKKYDLPFDYINRNPEQPLAEGLDGKVHADFFIDDRNVFFKGLHQAVVEISNRYPPYELRCETCTEYEKCLDVVNGNRRDMYAKGCLGYQDIKVDGGK